jgi:putative transposase
MHRRGNPNGVASIADLSTIVIMPQSISRVVIHTVFSTKGREPAFQNAACRSEVHAYLGGCAKTLDCLPIQIGGVADHVHLLTTLPRTLCIADFVKEVKRVSTGWIQERGGLFTQFHWQAGYDCFSVSESMVPKVVRYIEGQEEHHRVITFQDEYRELLRRHGQTWDEQYLWD